MQYFGASAMVTMDQTMVNTILFAEGVSFCSSARVAERFSEIATAGLVCHVLLCHDSCITGVPLHDMILFFG